LAEKVLFKHLFKPYLPHRTTKASVMFIIQIKGHGHEITHSNTYGKPLDRIHGTVSDHNFLLLHMLSSDTGFGMQIRFKLLS
jgi:hypothetical protein